MHPSLSAATALTQIKGSRHQATNRLGHPNFGGGPYFQLKHAVWRMDALFNSITVATRQSAEMKLIYDTNFFSQASH
jgi:hypothetical protein